MSLLTINLQAPHILAALATQSDFSLDETTPLGNYIIRTPGRTPNAVTLNNRLAVLPPVEQFPANLSSAEFLQRGALQDITRFSNVIVYGTTFTTPNKTENLVKIADHLQNRNNPTAQAFAQFVALNLFSQATCVFVGKQTLFDFLELASLYQTKPIVPMQANNFSSCLSIMQENDNAPIKVTIFDAMTLADASNPQINIGRGIFEIELLFSRVPYNPTLNKRVLNQISFNGNNIPLASHALQLTVNRANFICDNLTYNLLGNYGLVRDVYQTRLSISSLAWLPAFVLTGILSGIMYL